MSSLGCLCCLLWGRGVHGNQVVQVGSRGDAGRCQIRNREREGVCCKCAEMAGEIVLNGHGRLVVMAMARLFVVALMPMPA